MAKAYGTHEQVNVVVVHPLTLMRELLVRALAASGLEVVGQAEALSAPVLHLSDADVVLVHESALGASDDRFDVPAVVVLLMTEADDLTVSRARDAGVAAFAVSAASPSALADTLRRAARRTRRTHVQPLMAGSRRPESDRYG